MQETLVDSTSIKRGFVDLPEGQIHYRFAGSGKKTLLMLRQTPRSSDEFLDEIPLFAKEYRVLAMDTIGYGDSYKIQGTPSIEDYAAATITMLDKLGVSSFT